MASREHPSNKPEHLLIPAFGLRGCGKSQSAVGEGRCSDFYPTVPENGNPPTSSRQGTTKSSLCGTPADWNLDSSHMSSTGKPFGESNQQDTSVPPLYKPQCCPSPNSRKVKRTPDPLPSSSRRCGSVVRLGSQDPTGREFCVQRPEHLGTRYDESRGECFDTKM